jgi:hypothetical protein
VSHANGTKTATKTDDDSWDTSIQTEPAGAWDTPTNGDTPAQADALKETAPAEAPKTASASGTTSKKSGGWASLFAKPPPAPVAAPAPAPVAAAQPEETPSTTVTAPPDQPAHLDLPPIEPQIIEDTSSDLPSAPHSEAPNDITPSKDELTETNLEQLPDESHPPASQTVASTTASTQDPLSQATAAAKTPIRPASGYAATALKATAGAGRSASFTRKVKEQQEAVVMPGHHAVEKAAVQFGKMGLNGDGDDLDEDREEPETRVQLPEDSPVAPRASLPPALPEAQPAPSSVAEIQAPTEPAAAQRHAPGLPPVSQQTQQQAPQAAPGFDNAYRYGQQSRTYDPFGQPPSSQTATTQAPAQSQEAFASQVPGQPLTSAAPDMASYYSREAAYQQYYGYGQQQDAQRGASAFGTSAQDTPSQYATARPQQGFGQQDATNSGNNTPAPTMPSQQSHASQQQAQQQQQMGGAHAGYPYGYPGAYGHQYPQYGQNYMNQMSAGRYGAGRPMFDDARRQQDDYYNNQYAYGNNQQHYGGGSYKSSMYGQPHQQYSYDHSSSPANAATFGGRESMYARSGSTQPSEQQASASSHAFGGNAPDPFGRSSSGFGQSQSLGQHGSHQGSEEVAKASGPSPSMQGGRPGSTVNSSQGQQSGLGQSQTHGSGQQAFGGYPQYGGGFGNFGGQQATHQTSGYGAYGNNAFGSYGGYGGGRGWNH